jgi:hypothetical protein
MLGHAHVGANKETDPPKISYYQQARPGRRRVTYETKERRHAHASITTNDNVSTWVFGGGFFRRGVIRSPQKNTNRCAESKWFIPKVYSEFGDASFLRRDWESSEMVNQARCLLLGQGRRGWRERRR